MLAFRPTARLIPQLARSLVRSLALASDTRRKPANRAVPIPESAAHPAVYNPFFQPADGKRGGGRVSSRRKNRGAWNAERGGEAGRKGEREREREWNRAHVRSPQAQRVKGRDAKGKTSAENGERAQRRERGEGESEREREIGRERRLEDRQTRGGHPCTPRPLVRQCKPTFSFQCIVSIVRACRLRGLLPVVLPA